MEADWPHLLCLQFGDSPGTWLTLLMFYSLGLAIISCYSAGYWLGLSGPSKPKAQGRSTEIKEIHYNFRNYIKNTNMISWMQTRRVWKNQCIFQNCAIVAEHPLNLMPSHQSCWCMLVISVACVYLIFFSNQFGSLVMGWIQYVNQNGTAIYTLNRQIFRRIRIIH